MALAKFRVTLREIALYTAVVVAKSASDAERVAEYIMNQQGIGAFDCTIRDRDTEKVEQLP